MADIACDLYQNPHKTRCSGSISPDGEGLSVCWRHLQANRDEWMRNAQDAADWIGVVRDELVLAGGKRGDRTVALANLRAVIEERDSRISLEEHAAGDHEMAYLGSRLAVAVDAPPCDGIENCKDAPGIGRCAYTCQEWVRGVLAARRSEDGQKDWMCWCGDLFKNEAEYDARLCRTEEPAGVPPPLGSPSAQSGESNA